MDTTFHDIADVLEHVWQEQDAQLAAEDGAAEEVPAR